MPKRVGLTLIELLAALAIAAALAMAALSVTTTLARTERVNRPRHEARYLTASLQHLLSVDLLNAREYRVTERGFALRGHAALAARTLNLEHLPSVVTYEVKRIEGRMYLLRRQESEVGSESVELVAAGIRAVRFRPAQERRGGAGWKATPEAAVVAVEFDRAEGKPSEFLVRIQ